MAILIASGTYMHNAEEQRKRNVRLGLILGSVAVVFFVGFIVRMALL